MNLFKKKIEATTQENIELTAEVESLKTELAATQALAESPTEDLATLQASFDVQAVKLEELKLKNAELEVENAAIKEQAASEVADFETKLASSVAKEVADNGLDEGFEAAEEQEQTVLEKFAKLTGPAKTEFYKQNKAEISALTFLK